jgi:HD superfamily phosphohydrolase YqeK
MAGQIFISYRRSYRDRVDTIVDGLHRAGYEGFELFRDVDDIVGGEDWTPQLERALAQARVVLAVVGAGWAQDRHGDWVRKELESALAHRIKVVVAVLPDGIGELGGLDASLQPVLAGQAVMLRDGARPADVDALVRALRRAGVHPSRSADEWTQLLLDEDIGDTAEGLRSLVSARIARWDEGGTPPEPSVVVLEGGPGSGRSTTMRAVLRDATSSATAVKSLHLPVGALRDDAPAAVATTWIVEALRWASQHADQAGRDAVAAALVQAVRSGFDGSRLPSELVADLPISARNALIGVRSRRTAVRGQLASVVLDLLDRLAATVPLVLGADDVDRLDATSVEVIRQVAERAAEDADRRTLLVLCGAPVHLLDDVPPSAVERVQVGSRVSMDRFLDRCAVQDPAARELLRHVGATTPVLAVAYLQHLRLTEALTLDASGSWRLADGLTADRAPSLSAALDAGIDRFVAPTWQKVVGVGAMIGPVFPLAAAIHVAHGHEPDADEVARCWEELRSADPDQLVLRCREIGGRHVVAFASTSWWSRLRDRLLQADRNAPAAALAAVLAGESGAGFDDWVVAARLYEEADDPGAAGDAYLRAARAARLELSNEAAAWAYSEAARQLWESAQRGDGDAATTARVLTRIGYCYFRAANLLAVSATDARSTAARSRLTRQAALRLTEAEQTLATARELLAAWTAQPAPPPDLDLLVIVDADVQSEDDVRVGLQLATLEGYVRLQRGRNILAAGAGEAPGADTPAEAEHHLLTALRFAEEGLSGVLRRQLVLTAGAGLAVALAHRAAAAGTSVERRWAARSSLLHGSRAIMLRSLITDFPDDPQSNRSRDEAVAAVLHSRALLADLLDLHHLAAHVRHRRDPRVGDAPPAALVRDLAALVCPPERRAHALAVEAAAREVLAAQAATFGLDDDATLDDDVAIVADAHDLFRDVEGARLLTMCRDVGYPIDGEAFEHPVLLHGDLASVFLERDLGLAEALGDRFGRVRLAVATHTVGFDPTGVHPPDAAFAMVMHLADARARSFERRVGHEGRTTADGADGRIERRDPVAEAWRLAVEEGDLHTAYGLVLANRAEEVRAEGRTLSPTTRRLVDRLCADVPGSVAAPVVDLRAGTPIA